MLSGSRAGLRLWLIISIPEQDCPEARPMGQRRDGPPSPLIFADGPARAPSQAGTAGAPPDTSGAPSGHQGSQGATPLSDRPTERPHLPRHSPWGPIWTTPVPSLRPQPGSSLKTLSWGGCRPGLICPISQGPGQCGLGSGAFKLSFPELPLWPSGLRT